MRPLTIRMTLLTLLAAAAVACGGAAEPGAGDDAAAEAGQEAEAPVTASADATPEIEQARRVLAAVPLVDGHNDVPWQYRTRVDNHLDEIRLDGDTSELDPPMHTDLRRLEEGMLGAQFWSVYIPADMDGPGAARAVLEQIDVARRMVERYPDAFEMAATAADLERVFAAGRIASMLGMEGGHAIESSLAVLRRTYDLGVRYMTLTHGLTIAWADSATDEPQHGGLTEFGREVVREMNRLGMLVDLSHVSPDTMHDALDTSEAPMIFSHSSARGLVDHPRNVPDDVLRRLPDNGGVVMVTFVPSFINEEVRLHFEARDAEQERLAEAYDEQQVDDRLDAWDADHPAPRATLADVADHIERVVEVAGVDHVGIGSDFDGISSVPVGLEDVSTYPDLFAELARRGYTEEELGKIAGNNLLRVMRRAEEVASRLQAERPPSDALIEELDGARAGGQGGGS